MQSGCVAIYTRLSWNVQNTVSVVGVYIHTCVYILHYSNEKESPCLNENDVRLFKHVCKRLNLPVQYPVAVCFLKRVSVIDNPTGRMIDYRSSNESATFFNVISVTSTFESPVTQFGMIKSLCLQGH